MILIESSHLDHHKTCYFLDRIEIIYPSILSDRIIMNENRRIYMDIYKYLKRNKNVRIYRSHTRI